MVSLGLRFWFEEAACDLNRRLGSCEVLILRRGLVFEKVAAHLRGNCVLDRLSVQELWMQFFVMGWRQTSLIPRLTSGMIAGIHIEKIGSQMLP